MVEKIKKNIAMIPARIGSQRLKYKNLILIKNKPLIYYAINAAKKSKKFDDIYLNSDSKIFKNIAKRYKINFHLRPKKLGKNNIKSDDVVFEFLENVKCQNLFWINSIAPLQSSNEIIKAVEFFERKRPDSFFTVNTKKVHAYYNNKPLNFIYSKKFDQTQELLPFSEINYNMMAWKVSKFTKSFKQKGFAFFCGKTILFESSKFSNFIVKNIDDLNIIKKIYNDRYINLIKYDDSLNII